MGMIAEASGGFCCAGRDGKIYFKGVGQDTAEIPLKFFENYKFGEEYKISRVAYEDGIRSFKFGDETRNTLWVNQDNLFIVDEEQIQNIYNQLKDLTIYSFEGSAIVDPAWDMGDKIIINGKPIIYQGEMSLSRRFKADIKSKISIKQKQETTAKTQSQTAINRKILSEIDQANLTITQLVQEQTETETKLSEHKQTIDEMQDTISQVDKKVDGTKEELSTQITQTAEGVKSEVTKSITDAKKEAIDSANSSTDSKLEKYTTTVQSLIDQKSDTILQTVSADYATKTSLDNVNKTLTASLELKVDTKNLISAINASADRISLTAGRLVITAGNFKLDEKGNITATGGTIGGFSLGATEFSSDLNGTYNYDKFDLRILTSLLLGFTSNSSVLREIFDANSDNEINSGDLLYIAKILNGTQVNNKKITGNIKINSKDPKKALYITKNGEVCVSLGVEGINSSFISAENIVCSTKSNTNSTFRGVAINGLESNPMITVTDGYEANTSQITATSISSQSFFTTDGNDILSTAVLYDNTSGAIGNIQLNDSASNYKYIEIFYNNKSERVYSPDGKNFNFLWTTNDSGNIVFRTGVYGISKRTITKISETKYDKYNNTITSSNETLIYRVVGYR